MTQKNAAYDLSLFEAKAPHVVALEPNKKQQQEALRRNRLQTAIRVVTALFFSALVLGAVVLMIVSRVRLTEMNENLSELEEQLAILESEHIRLNGELSAQVSAESIESYALSHGMQKTEPHQIVYFTMEPEDRIAVPEEEEADWWTSLCHTVAEWFS